MKNRRNISIQSPVLEKDLICGICLDLNMKSQQCKTCKQIFCTECITKWLQEKDYCPFRCSKPMILQKLSRLKQKSISNSYKSCSNDWCKQDVKLEDLKNHLKGCWRRAIKKQEQQIEKQNSLSIDSYEEKERAIRPNFDHYKMDFENMSLNIEKQKLEETYRLLQTQNCFRSKSIYNKVKNVVLKFEEKKKNVKVKMGIENMNQTARTVEQFQFSRPATLSLIDPDQRTPEKFRLGKKLIDHNTIDLETKCHPQLNQLNKEQSYLKQYHFKLIGKHDLQLIKNNEFWSSYNCKIAMKNGLYCQKHNKY